MDWCIRKKLDGVITDDPEKFLDFCNNFDEAAKPMTWPLAALLNLIKTNIFIWLFGIVFWRKHGFGLDQRYLVQDKRD